MSAIREEIRAILREELAAILADHSGGIVRSVRVETSDDLNRFARDLADQLTEPGFAEKLQRGEVTFALERRDTTAPGRTTPVIPAAIQSTPKQAAPFLDKKLITETDMAAVAPGVLRVPRHARLTPLAKDEARRKGVRIERTET